MFKIIQLSFKDSFLSESLLQILFNKNLPSITASHQKCFALAACVRKREWEGKRERKNELETAVSLRLCFYSLIFMFIFVFLVYSYIQWTQETGKRQIKNFWNSLQVRDKRIFLTETICRLEITPQFDFHLSGPQINLFLHFGKN